MTLLKCKKKNHRLCAQHFIPFVHKKFSVSVGLLTTEQKLIQMNIFYGVLDMFKHNPTETVCISLLMKYRLTITHH